MYRHVRRNTQYTDVQIETPNRFRGGGLKLKNAGGCGVLVNQRCEQKSRRMKTVYEVEVNKLGMFISYLSRSD